MKRSLFVLVAVSLLLTLPLGSSAQAGGAPWGWDQPYYEPGDTVRGRTSVWTKTTFRDRGRPEDGPYFAYLLPQPNDWDVKPSESPNSIYLGEIAVDAQPNESHGTATIEFVMPDVEAGEYWVAHCNEGCRLELGDLVSTRITVAENDVEGRLDFRLDKLRARLHNTVYRLRLRIGRVERERRLLGSKLAAVTDAHEAAVRGLQERVAKLERARADGWSGMQASLVAGAAALAFAAVVRRRRQ